jgi:hypothetical protein
MTEFGSLLWGLQLGEGSTRKQTDHHGVCLRETQKCGRQAGRSSCGGRSAAECLVLLERSAPSRARPRAGQQHILCMFNSVLCNNSIQLLVRPIVTLTIFTGVLLQLGQAVSTV